MGRAEYAPLKTFLIKDAKTYHQEDVAKTFVLVEQGINKPPVLGYVTLICSEIEWAIANVIENIMPNTGCRFLILDSKKSSVQYYEQRGFTLLDTDGNRNSNHLVLFIDLHKLQHV